MSKEVLEISVLVDEKFDVSFDLVEGIFGFILKFFAK
ncbi:phenylalanyl-tRNA synthetase subunit alpha [Pedobacter sp. GR22-6]